MNLIPKSQRFFYLTLGTAIVAATMVIFSAHRTQNTNFVTTQAVTQDQMSTNDDLDSIQKDLDDTNVDNLDSEMKDIDSQFSY